MTDKTLDQLLDKINVLQAENNTLKDRVLRMAAEKQNLFMWIKHRTGSDFRAEWEAEKNAKR